MSLWDRIIDETAPEEHVEDEKIVIHLTKNHAWIEVEAYHDSVFEFLRHAVDILGDMAKSCECDLWEKACLLNDWLDSLKDIKDRRFKEMEDEIKDD